ncbi:hypothetical protein P3S67_000646 [Capsicum chacoense]
MHKRQKPFDCSKCLRKMTLVPRCMFQIDLTNATSSTTTLISGALGEKILFMTTEDIFGTTCVKLLHLDHIHQMLSNKFFNI